MTVRPKDGDALAVRETGQRETAGLDSVAADTGVIRDLDLREAFFMSRQTRLLLLLIWPLLALMVLV